MGSSSMTGCGEWIDTEDHLPDCRSDILIVKRKNGSITKAYFYSDKMQWLDFYGVEPTYFWEKHSQKPLYDVVHWLKKI